MGPGSTLKTMLSWFVTKPEDCDCDDRAELMDEWGTDGCLENVDEIVNWLKESANDKGIFAPKPAIKTLVRLAIALSTK